MRAPPNRERAGKGTHANGFGSRCTAGDIRCGRWCGCYQKFKLPTPWVVPSPRMTLAVACAAKGCVCWTQRRASAWTLRPIRL